VDAEVMDPELMDRAGSFRARIDRWAAEQPDAPFALFDTGERWSWAEAREHVLDTAAALQGAGVGRGDRVVMWLENSPAALRTWLAISYLGAVYVPLNTAYRGNLLAHVLDLAEARVMVAHADLVERLASVDTGLLATVFVVAGDGTPVDGLALRPERELTARRTADPAAPERPIEPFDTAAVMFTSGTTGPSKAVLSSHQHLYTMGQVSYPGTDRDDRGLVHSPLFHVTAMSAVCWAMGTGGSVAVISRFSTATFWRDVQALGGTFTVMQGSVTSFLLGQPVTPEEEATPLRQVLLAPLSPDAEALCRRVGLRYYSLFNMTETSVPIRTGFDPTEMYSCGVPRPGVSARLVDEHDLEVPRGEVGELILRCDEPWTMSSGYYRDPEATAAAWRNGWFHTGDACRQDEGGSFYYVDRVKDSIRRRGENISSYEVEVEVMAHPAVRDVAAIAVPSEYGEDDLLVVVVPEDGAEVDPAELVGFLTERVAHFMVPRYVRMADELPRTPTYKVQKALLRSSGTDGAWDREAAGIHVRRERLGS
jgi:carnitine-CoA ligase